MVKEKMVEELMETKGKIPPTRVLSDDCAVYVGRVIEDGEITVEGTAYHVHKDEWVELLPTANLEEMFALAGVVGSTNAEDPKVMIVESANALRQLCHSLSERVVSWNWTDNYRKSLPQPHNAPEVLMRLTNDELMWLMSAVEGKETSADRKNA